jgi:NAD(P)H dehydrogenase (quinone)
MMKPTLLVTGATGKTGGAVVQQLLSKGYPVRAIVRSHDVRSERLNRLGVETVVADMYDPDQLLQAMRGTARAYYLPLLRPYMIQSATAFAVAAQEAKLESIVQMSQWTSSPAHPTIMTRQTWLVDRMFSMIPNVAHTIVNPGMFADNYLRFIDFASLLGIFPVLFGTSKSAPVSNEDIARVIVAVLMDDPAKHAGKSYRPTGPKLLSARDMAAIIQKVVGNRVRPIDLPYWMFLKVARMQGVDPFTVYSVRRYMEDHKQGTFEFEGGVSDVLQQLTGSPAEDFETTARRYAALPFARKTFRNRLRASINFMITPFYPGYNLDRYEQKHEFPMPSEPQLCMESDRWKSEHRLVVSAAEQSQCTGTKSAAR